MKKKLSIIVPIYNVEKYLEKCLESIYKLNIDKEIILVNDESPDNSFLIIEKYKFLYPDETLVINQKNKGLSGARNSGLEIATGEYIYFIDSDDFIDVLKFEELFDLGEPKKLDIILGNYRKYRSGIYLDICKRDKKINDLGLVSGEEFLEKSIKHKCVREQVWQNIYNHDFLINNELKFKVGLLNEDTLFYIQALNKAKRVEYIDIPFYLYRQREGSLMSTYNYVNYQHRLYTIKELLQLQALRKQNFTGLNSYLLNILWKIFKYEKRVNGEILQKLLLSEKIYSIKDYLKILLMFIGSLRYHTIEIAKID